MATITLTEVDGGVEMVLEADDPTGAATQLAYAMCKRHAHEARFGHFEFRAGPFDTLDDGADR